MTGRSIPNIPPTSRLDSVDLLRGIVMVLMPLEHVRMAFTKDPFAPLNYNVISAFTFFTHWLPDFCAPIFFFLAGLSIFLSGRRKTRSELSSFLFTRGIWLIILEFTIIRFSWFFNFDYHYLMAQVFWTFGISMIVMAGMIHLPHVAVSAIAITVLAGHNLLDPIAPHPFGESNWIWTLLKTPATLEPWKGVRVLMLYPLIPWLGIMLAGYSIGPFYLWEATKRKWTLLSIGSLLLMGFCIFRMGNFYGDPTPWHPQPNSLATLFSFLHVEKYPASFLYCLMTISISLILLALFDGRDFRLAAPIITFGRVPLFFYLLHLPLINLIAIGFALFRYGAAGWFFENPPFPTQPSDYGYSLATIYLVWVGVLLVLYFCCRWFAEIKRSRRQAALSYL